MNEPSHKLALAKGKFSLYVNTQIISFDSPKPFSSLASQFDFNNHEELHYHTLFIHLSARYICFAFLCGWQ